MKTAKDKGEYVFLIFNLPYRPVGPDDSGSTSWRPLKDLLRAILSMDIHGNAISPGGEPGRVYVHDIQNGRFNPYASVSIKDEEHARVLFEWTAGNAWHGSILTVLWLSCFNNERRLIRRRGWTSSPFPLERFSPITDKKLLRPGRQRLRPGTVNNSSSLRLPQRSPLHRVIQVSQPSHYVGRRAAAGKGLSTGLPTPYYNAMVRSNFPNSKLLMPLGSLSSRNYQMTMDNQQYDGVSKALQYQSSSGGINFWIPHIMISDPLCSATLHHATPAMTSTMPVLAYPGPQVGATYTPFASPPSSRPHVCTGCYYTTLDRTPTSRDRENPSNTEHCVVTAGNLSHKMIQEAIKDGNSSKASITSSAKGGPVIANGAIDSLDFDLEAPILYDEKTVEGIADDGV